MSPDGGRSLVCVCPVEPGPGSGFPSCGALEQQRVLKIGESKSRVAFCLFVLFSRVCWGLVQTHERHEAA